MDVTDQHSQLLQLLPDEEDAYKPSKELLAAINISLLLKKPLLLSGDPGTGKTECAHYVARQLKKLFKDKFIDDKALRFDTKSYSQSTDLFYSYDAVGHFGDKTEAFKESFITFNKLGISILATNGKNEDLKKFNNYSDIEKYAGYGSVVLIDEVDKAPRDFPNDLLAELEKPPYKFNIREVKGSDFVQNPDLPIVVIITSNNEKALPDTFLRRCVFHHISFPEPGVLAKIVQSKLGDNPYFKPAIDIFVKIRVNKNVNKSPATSELIDWLNCLQERKLLCDKLENVQKAPKEYREQVVETIGTLAKTKADHELLKKEIAG